MNLAFLGPLGLNELLIILGICILLFGSSRIPKLGRAIGSTFSEFKKGIREAKEVGKELEHEAATINKELRS